VKWYGSPIGIRVALAVFTPFEQMDQEWKMSKIAMVD
jgi:hypothetical protein